MLEHHQKVIDFGSKGENFYRDYHAVNPGGGFLQLRFRTEVPATALILKNGNPVPQTIVRGPDYVQIDTPPEAAVWTILEPARPEGFWLY